MSVDGKVSTSAASATPVTHILNPSLAQNLQLQSEYDNELSRWEMTLQVVQNSATNTASLPHFFVHYRSIRTPNTVCLYLCMGYEYFPWFYSFLPGKYLYHIFQWFTAACFQILSRRPLTVARPPTLRIGGLLNNFTVKNEVKKSYKSARSRRVLMNMAEVPTLL